ncbi:MAG: N-acetylmuramoyl-L-alanine amidase [Firmicutes bacterium]|nr:N-acetylmuramoyl-L-alanine amidase [Bacillota bacterium]
MHISLVTSQGARRKFCLGFLIFLILAIVIPLTRLALPVSSTATLGGLPLAGKTIVLDPGHGGYDPGVMNNNVEEKNIVLEISLHLRDYLQAGGARVVMTRETDKDLLVVPTSGPKKREDMKNRMLLVESTNPELFVSLHANAIGSAQWHGAQVFHKSEHEPSKIVAEIVQQELIRILANTDRVIKPGNYYVLNEANRTAILVECGFISNPSEARLLSDSTYQAKVAWAIYVGILKYYHQTSPTS